MAMRKVAVCGSTTFPLNLEVGEQVVETIRGLGDVAILTRGTEGFEAFARTAALVLGLRCFSYLGGGGPDNWQRDFDLARDCDELVAFLDPATLEDPKTGTAHLIECALAARKPVRVATVADGTLVWAAQ